MIPLVDVKAQYAPLIPELKRAPRRGARVRAVHPRPERHGVRGGGGRLPRRPARRSASRTAPTRSCSSSTRWASARRRGDLPGVHLLRDRGGDRAGAAPRRCSPTSTRSTLNLDPEDVAAPDHAEDEGDHAGAPVRPPGAARRARRARRSRSSRTPRRRSAPPGSRPPASPRPSASSRRRTCSRSATAASSRVDRRRSSPSACGCSASTARATRRTFDLVGYNSRLDELQAAALRALPAAARRLERARAARPRRATPSSASASSCELPGRRAAATSTTCTSSARPSATGSPPR